MNEQEGISRREALGLFKAVAALGAGLMVSRNAFGDQKLGSVQIKHDNIVGPDFECRFYVTNVKLRNFNNPTMFTVKLPSEMVQMLAEDRSSNVQMKFFATHIKGEGHAMEWGNAQVKLNQGMLQHKDFQLQLKLNTSVQQKY